MIFFGEGRKPDERTNGQTHIGGDLLKSVPWSKSELFLVFRPSATQIVFFVRVLIPQ